MVDLHNGFIRTKREINRGMCELADGLAGELAAWLAIRLAGWLAVSDSSQSNRVSSNRRIARRVIRTNLALINTSSGRAVRVSEKSDVKVNGRAERAAEDASLN